MSNEEPKVEATPSASVSLDDLEAKRVALEQKIKEAMERKAKEKADREAAEAADKEAVAVEGKNEMENAYAEGQEMTKPGGDREKFNEEVVRAQKELEAFEGSKKQAEELGIPVEDDPVFMQALQERKGKLSGLEERRAELDAKMQNLASDEAVMNKIRDEADKENLTRQEESGAEQAKELIAEIVDTASRNCFKSAADTLLAEFKEEKQKNPSMPPTIPMAVIRNAVNSTILNEIRTNEKFGKLWHNVDVPGDFEAVLIKKLVSGWEKLGGKIQR